MERQVRKNAEEGRYLSFQLASETYAVPIRTVSEIIGLGEITHVPNLPEYIKGIINLRGRVLPVIDLRRKFSLAPASYTRETCIVIVEMWSRKVGLIVDTVKEVLDFKLSHIEPAPDIGRQSQTQCLIGIGKQPDRVVILIEPKLILSAEELPGSISFTAAAS